MTAQGRVFGIIVMTVIDQNTKSGDLRLHNGDSLKVRTKKLAEIGRREANTPVVPTSTSAPVPPLINSNKSAPVHVYTGSRQSLTDNQKQGLWAYFGTILLAGIVALPFAVIMGFNEADAGPFFDAWFIGTVVAACVIAVMIALLINDSREEARAWTIGILTLIYLALAFLADAFASQAGLAWAVGIYVGLGYLVYSVAEAYRSLLFEDDE